jgi:SAM-dependent methyltransferase
MSDQKRPPDNWAKGDVYDRYVGRWSRKVAPEFLAWLGVPPARRWLDVGCGTGALCGAILDQCAPASVAGVEPSEGFLATAKEHLGARAVLRQGSATSIPLAPASADVIVSGLVLNFVPEKEAAMNEMKRVAAAGGTIAAYVWDYSDKMEFMRYFWDAAVAVDPAASSRAEGNRFPICKPDALAQLFRQSGLVDVETRAIDTPTVFRDFADYWTPFEGGQGPAPVYAMSLDDAARGRLRDRLEQSLPVERDGSIHLIARAWAVRSKVA